MTLLALALAVDPALAAQKYKDPDDKRDWAGARFGTSPLEGMKCDPGALDTIKVCSRPDKADLEIGKYKADKVTYTYFEKRLYRVDIMFDTDDEAARITPVLHSLYGPSSWNPAERNEMWKGETTMILWTQHLRTNGWTLSYVFAPIVEDVEAARVKGGGAELAAAAMAL